MLADKLKAMRDKFGVTQQQVADILNIDRSTYSYYETGKSCPTLDTLVRLARLFGTSTDDLLDFRPVLAEPTADVPDDPSMGVISNNERSLLTMYRALSMQGKLEAIEFVEAKLAEQNSK